MLKCIGYLHSLGICHRDIKPQNILIDPADNTLKLCDFGCAKHLVKTESNIAYISSRFYRPPELVIGATIYTTQVDVWSMGCVIAELVINMPIFAGKTATDQLLQIMKVLGTPTPEEIKAMNEKFVKVEVFVDTTNPEQLGALGAFLSTIGGVTVPIPVSEPQSEPQPEKPAKPAKPSKPAKTPKAEPASEPEPEPQPEKPAAGEKTYQVEEVREKLKEKVADHREEIKAKLTELGAPNVSSLDPSKYTEFVNFLEGLE